MSAWRVYWCLEGRPKLKKANSGGPRRRAAPNRQHNKKIISFRFQTPVAIFHRVFLEIELIAGVTKAISPINTTQRNNEHV